METQTPTRLKSPEELTINAWRTQELQAAGYPLVAATRLALNPNVDLHQACDLLAQGCPLPTAIRILT